MLCLLIVVCQFAQYFASHDCVLEDSTCWTKFYNSIGPKIVDGFPELGTERLDPMHLDLIEWKKNAMFYRSTNNTLTGLKGLIIDDISFHKDLKVMVLVFGANLTLRGDYTIFGSFFLTPINGNGKIELLLNNCRVEMIMPYEIIKDGDDKSRLNLRYNLFSAHPYGGLHFTLENLLTGQSDLSEDIHTLLNTNWRVFEKDVAAKTLELLIKKFFEAFRAVVASNEIIL